jgi:hypothetical protein
MGKLESMNPKRIWDNQTFSYAEKDLVVGPALITAAL